MVSIALDAMRSEASLQEFKLIANSPFNRQGAEVFWL
jgi:hypothetical protein